MATELEKVLNRSKDGRNGKSILIIDTPETCDACPIYDFEYDQCQIMMERAVEYHGAKTEGCPLQTVHEYHGGKCGWVRDDEESEAKQ